MRISKRKRCPSGEAATNSTNFAVLPTKTKSPNENLPVDSKTTTATNFLNPVVSHQPIDSHGMMPPPPVPPLGRNYSSQPPMYPFMGANQWPNTSYQYQAPQSAPVYFNPYELARAMQQPPALMRLNDISNNSASSFGAAFNQFFVAQKPLNSNALSASNLSINPYQGFTNNPATFIPVDPANTSMLTTAKTSSYYCLTPASSTTSLNDLNHSLSMNLHLNSSSNESLISANKKTKTVEAKTGSQRSRASATKCKPSETLNSTVTSGEPVKRKRGRPRKSIAAEPILTPTLPISSPQPRNVSSKSMVNLQRSKTSENQMNYVPKAIEAITTSPLPHLNWANSTEVWDVMKRKESEQYKHDWRYLSSHIDIEPRMRAILLDWLVEICHAYRLHRETFHLAVEYFDRFMTVSKQRIRVDRLQLIGMTSLFIAAKVEEIYPPKLKELASHIESYASNTEQAISEFEIYMLKTLEWRISPVTPNTWLLAYLQISSTFDESTKIHNSHYVMPMNLTQSYQWSVSSANVFKRESFFLTTYLKSATLLDLCLMDIESLRFRYSELAAAALYLMMPVPPASDSTMVRVRLVEKWTGFTWRELEACVNWMLPYADVCRDFITDEKMVSVRQFSSVEPDDAHNIQMYHKYFDLWKEVQPRKTPQKTLLYQIQNMQDMLTPPISNQKNAIGP